MVRLMLKRDLWNPFAANMCCILSRKISPRVDMIYSSSPSIAEGQDLLPFPPRQFGEFMPCARMSERTLDTVFGHTVPSRRCEIWRQERFSLLYPTTSSRTRRWLACPGLPHGARCAHGRPYRWHQRNDRPFADVMRVCVHELGTTGEAAAGDRLLRSYGWSDSAKETIAMF